MKNKTWRKIIALALCILTLVAVLPARSAEAENVCRLVSGNCTKKTTFKVKTGSRWLAKKDVLKLTQKKGVLLCENTFRNSYTTSTYKVYEKYTVTVKKISGKKVVKTSTYIFDKSSIKIKLDKYSTYQITVTCEYAENNGFTHGTAWYDYFSTALQLGRLPLAWKTPSTWKVASTKGLTTCG